MWVVKVAVWVDSAEDAKAQPTEVLFTRGTGHLVAAVHFLQRQTIRGRRRSKHQTSNMSKIKKDFFFIIRKLHTLL